MRKVTKVGVWRKAADRRDSIGGSNARVIMGDDEGTLLQLRKEKRGEVASEDLSVQLGVTTEDLTRRWYERITGRWYIVGLCYATAVILLGWWPWNLLLMPVLASRNPSPLRFRVFVAPDASVRSKVFCGRGGPI